VLTNGPERMLDEAEAYTLLAEIGVAHAPYVAISASQAGQGKLPFAYPVAVKILHRDIPHKTDFGGVVLGVESDTALAEAASRIIANVSDRCPTLGIDRVLVQAMVKPLGEVLVGYRRDPQVGPIILLAAGGILTEIYRDRSVRIAPVDLAGAREMIEEVRALRALEGYRGRLRGDLEALAAAIVALSHLGERPQVVDCEVNPLMVLDEGRGVMAVDALISIAG
jgi:succinyl-CoA synthetase beta subunit